MKNRGNCRKSGVLFSGGRKVVRALGWVGLGLLSGQATFAWATDYSFFAPGTVELTLGSGTTVGVGATWSGLSGGLGAGVAYVANTYVAPITGRYTFLSSGRDSTYDRLISLHDSSFSPSSGSASVLSSALIEQSVGFYLTTPASGTYPYPVSFGADLTASASYRLVNSGYQTPPLAGTTDRGQYVNRVRYSPSPIQITDDSPLSPVSRTLSISQAYIATEVTGVTLHGLAHTYMSDLVITLKRGSTSITLFDRGGQDADFLGGDVRFATGGVLVSQIAATSLVAGAVLAPAGSLAGLANQSIAGDWTIEVSDWLGGDVGSFTGFSVSFALAEVGWLGNVSGSWSDNARWSGGVAPNVKGIPVRFGNVITQARTVSVPTEMNVGSLTFDSAFSYTLSGAGSVVVNSDTPSPAEIRVLQGNHVVSSDVVLSGDTEISITAGRKLTVGSMRGGSVAQVTVTGGTLAVTKVLEAERLVMGGAAFVDLASGGAVVLHGMSEAEVRGWVAMWWNGGKRIPVGLGSSVAGTGAGRDGLATLAVALNDNGSGGRFLTSLNGISLATSDVMVRYTYLGDTDLNGTVDANDLQRLINGLRLGLKGWGNGDNNYDGVVDSNDLANLLKVMRLQGASFDSGGGSAGGTVPEVGGWGGGLMLGFLCLSRRRRGGRGGDC